MDSERLKFCINALRIFIRGGERGNYLTLHADEIENSLCRSMCKRSANDRRNIHDQLLAILNALKDKGVFFLGQDDWSDDKLPRSKKKDKKKIYGLTDRAIKFLELQKAAGNSGESNDTIKRLLQHFDILPRQEPEQTPTPNVAVEAEENTQKQTEEDMRIIDVIPQQVEIPAANQTPAINTNTTPKTDAASNKSTSISQIVAKLNNASRSDQTRFVPSQLLADLVRAKALSASTYATGKKLDWPSGSYTNALKLLKELGLIDNASRLITNNDGEKYARAYGIWLTDLGVQVAESADVVTKYPPVSPNIRRSRQIMVADKGAKKREAQMPAPTTQTVYGRVTRPDGTEMLIYDRDLARQLLGGSASDTHPSLPHEKAGAELQADEYVTATDVEPDLYETLGSVIAGAITGLYDGISSMHPARIRQKNPDTDITRSNSYAISCALSKLNIIIDEMRKYCNYCRAKNLDIDIDFVTRYCNEVVEETKRYGNGGILPKMNFPVEVGYSKTLSSSVPILIYDECATVRRAMNKLAAEA